MQLEAANNKAMNRRMRIFREYRIDCAIPRIFHVVDFASWRSLSASKQHVCTLFYKAEERQRENWNEN